MFSWIKNRLPTKWTTNDGRKLKLKNMSTDHLSNCKNLLERGDTRMNNLSKPWTYYDKCECVGVEPNFGDLVFKKPDYTTSPEYKAICKELNKRE